MAKTGTLSQFRAETAGEAGASAGLLTPPLTVADVARAMGHGREWFYVHRERLREMGLREIPRPTGRGRLLFDPGLVRDFLRGNLNRPRAELSGFPTSESRDVEVRGNTSTIVLDWDAELDKRARALAEELDAPQAQESG